jgi:hypothetical protein
MKELAK